MPFVLISFMDQQITENVSKKISQQVTINTTLNDTSNVSLENKICVKSHHSLKRNF